MPTLIVGSFEAKMGIEYSGLVPNGNAFRLTDDVRMSINRTPLAPMPRYTDIYALPYYTYSFSKDSIILLSRVVQDDLTIIWLNECVQTVTLVNGTESDTICSVVIGEATATGTITCQANVFNDNGSDKNVTINCYKGAALLSSTTNQIEKRKEMQTVLSFEITAALTKDDVIDFKLVAAANNMTVEGGNSSSKIQVTRRS